MKKLICFSLVLLVLLSCLTACSFTQKAVNALASEAEATPKVKEMVAALTEDRTADAKALLHPQVVETSDNAIEQMRGYLAGRSASAIDIKGVNINTSTGTAGKTRQEQLTCQVTLTDGEIIYLNVVYLSNKHGAGFTAFQVVLGIV